MSHLAETCDWPTHTRYLGPARVVEVDDSGTRVLLRSAGSPEGDEVWATLAVAGPCELRWGDSVLAICGDDTDWYVIGVLHGRPEGRRVALDNGSYAQASGEPGAERLQIFSEGQELLFEYDEQNRTARVNLESGDLEFVTRRGSISFSSDREILFDGESVGITARSGLRLTAARLETVVDSLVEKAKNVYRTVEQLSQLRAGRMRTLVRSTFHFKARRAFLKSEKDYKINAEKIHLG